MKAATIGLFSALLLPIARAAPLEKRDIVWITVTSDVIETVDVTSTVYVDAADVTAAAAAETQVVVTVTATATAEQATPAAAETTSTTDAPVQAVVAAPSTPSAASTSSSSSTPAPEPAAATSTSSSVAEEPAYTAAPSPSTTSSTQAADPTTSEEPTTTSAAAAATSSAASSSASSGSSGSCDAGDPTSGSPCTGDITYYTPGLGACGTTSTESDLIVALDVDFMGSASNNNPYCGKSITLSYGGVTATGTVVDKCMGCPSKTSIDLSPAFFEKFGSLDAGKIADVEWWFD